MPRLSARSRRGCFPFFQRGLAAVPRSAAAWVFCASLVPPLLGAGGSAEAQEVLVSNLNSATSPSVRLGAATDSKDAVQLFTTGTNTGGYTLNTSEGDVDNDPVTYTAPMDTHARSTAARQARRSAMRSRRTRSPTRTPATPRQLGPCRRDARPTLVAFALAVLAVLATLAPEPAAAQTRPPAPTNLTATVGNRSVTLSWTTPGDGGSAIIRHQLRIDDGGWSDIPNSGERGANANSHTRSPLDNGIQFTFEVRAVTGVGPGDPSNKVTAAAMVVTKPPAPTNLTAAAGDGSVALGWTTPGDGGSAIIRHQYREKVGAGSYGGWSDIPNSGARGANATGYRVPSRTNGTTYSYQVRAVNGVSESDPSNEDSATPTAAATRPPAPTNLTAAAGDGSVVLGWTTPGDGGSAIIKHQYREKVGAGSYGGWSDIPNSGARGANATGYRVPSRTSGTTYSYQVRAVNGVSESDPSNEDSATPTAAATRPPAPTNLTATVGNRSVTLSWTTPGDGGSAIIRHQLRIDDGGWSDIPNSGERGANANSHTRSPLDNGIQFTFEVRAVTGVGPGDPSNKVTAAAMVVTKPPAPTNLTAAAGDGSVALGWTTPGDGGSAIIRHQYREKVGAGSYGGWSDIPNSGARGANATGYRVPSRTNGTTYSYQVRAVNGVSESDPSNEDSATPTAAATRPPAPTNLTAAAGDGSVVLGWTTPGDGGSAIIKHQYREKVGAGSYGGWSDIPNSGARGANATGYRVPSRTSGTTYSYQVRAVNGVSESDPSNEDSATPTAAATRPPAPTNLTATVGNRSVTLSWTTPGDGGSAIIRHQLRIDDGGWSDIPNSGERGANANSHTRSPLDNGIQFTFEVRAVTGVGPGDPSNKVTAAAMVVTKPPAPTNLTAAAGDGSVALGWTTPGDGGSAIIRHQYREKVGAGSYGGWSDIPNSGARGANATGYRVPSRTNGTTYSYQVRAVNGVSESDPSNEDSATPTAAATRPPAPTNLTAAAGDGSVVLGWTTPGDGGSAIIKHQYREKVGAGSYGGWSDIPNSGARGANATGYRVPSRTSGTTYSYQVRAVNGVSESDPSNEDSATPTAAATRPPAPTNLTATVGNRSVTLSWTTPGDGGSAIIRHQLRIDDGGWSDIPNSGERGANANSHTRSPLDNGIQFTFEVRAVTGVGPGDPSNKVTAAAMVVTKPPAPTNLTAAAGDGSVALGWTTPGDGGSAIIRHQYREKVGAGSYGGWSDIPNSGARGANATGYRVPSRTNGTTYSYQVRAVNGVSESDPSNEDSATPTAAATRPPAPTNLTAAAGDGSVVLGWTTPGDGGSAIIKHQYREKVGAGSYGGWSDIPNSGARGANATGYRVPSRTSGTTYSYQVRAVNGVSESDPSNEDSATPTAAATRPPAPTNLTATVGNRSVTLSWTTPGDGGSAIIRHQLRIDDGGWSDIPNSGERGANANSHTRSPLDNGIQFTFEVRAVTGVGPGDPSNKVTAAAMVVTKPPAPTNLTAAAGDGSVALGWTTPGDGGSAIIRHQYREKVGAGSYGGWSDIPNSGARGANATGYRVPSRTNGTTYSYQVRAVNGVSESDPSNEDSATPTAAATRPPAPTNLTAAAGDGSVVLGWTTPGDGGSAIIKHQYREKVGAGSYGGWSDIPNSGARGANATGYRVPSRTSGTTYSYQVRAVNGVSESDPSNEDSATPTAAATRPPAPTNLTATVGNRSVTLSWTTPGDGGSAIIRHQLRIDDGGWSDIPNSGERGANANSHTRSPLDNGIQFTFEVRAVTGVGPGDPSNKVTAAAMVVTKPPAPTNLTAAAGDGSVALGWTTPGDGGSAIIRHQYREKVGAGSYGGWSDIPNSGARGANATGYRVPSRTNGTTYSYQVRAVNGVSESDPSNEDSATPTAAATRPPAPTNLTAAAGDGSVVLGWTTPGDGGSAIIKHQYREKVGAGSYGGWSDIPNSGARGANATGYRVPSRTSGTTYSYQVRAVNGVSESDPSNEDSATPTAAATRPPAPTNLTATVGNRSVTLSWTTPGDGGSAIIRHQLRIDDGGWSDIPNSGERGANANSHTRSPLDNGIQFTFEVRAVTGVGPGDPSNKVTAAATDPPGDDGDPDGGDGGGTESFRVDIVGVPDVAVAGESYELTAESDSGSLVYAWQADRGILTPDDAQTVVWTAPETAGVAWIHVDVTREDGATAGQSAYVRVEVPEPEPEPVPALPLLGQLLLALGLLRLGVMRLSRRGAAGT